MSDETRELLIRIVTMIPLVVITVQVIMLRRILRSTAWTLLAVGFVIFCLIRATVIVWSGAPLTGLLLSMGLGYGMIAAGLHKLRHDLLAALGQKR